MSTETEWLQDRIFLIFNEDQPFPAKKNLIFKQSFIN